MKINANYTCTQGELYVVTRMAWENYLEDFSEFKKFKGKYTTALADNALSAISAARALPDEQTRNAQHESLRIDLTKVADSCLANWQSLKSYIGDAFNKDQQKPMLEAAGSDYYRDATQDNWVATLSLLNAAGNFMVDHSAELTGGGNNMPAAFAVKFGADKTTFETTYNNFLKEKGGNEADTDAKIAANNAINTGTASMLADGQLIYTGDSTKKLRYIFDHLLGLVTSAGPTGLRLKITEEITELPLPGIVAILQPGDYKIVTGEDGIAKIEIPEDDYTMAIADTETHSGTALSKVAIRTGVIHQEAVVLKRKVG